MTHIDTEQRNPYYINPLFLSIQLPDEKRRTDIYHLSLHTEVTTFDNPDPIIVETENPKWRYEGIGSNAKGEKCYLFELTQWPIVGDKKLLMIVYIPLGLFHRQSIYLPWSQELTEDDPLVPAITEYLENLGSQLISTSQEELFRKT